MCFMEHLSLTRWEVFEGFFFFFEGQFANVECWSLETFNPCHHLLIAARRMVWPANFSEIDHVLSSWRAHGSFDYDPIKELVKCFFFLSLFFVFFGLGWNCGHSSSLHAFGYDGCFLHPWSWFFSPWFYVPSYHFHWIAFMQILIAR